MRATATKTDNANVEHKVQLRKEATRGIGELKVLDLFAGNNVLWSRFECKKYFGIEIEKGKGKNLHANNLKVIPSLDLSAYNVIDCDSYGMPMKQLEQIFKNPTLKGGTVIIYTAIGNGISALSTVALRDFGLTKMYKKSKVLFNKRSDDLFHAWLYEKGVREVREYEEESPTFTKKYGYFIIKE